LFETYASSLSATAFAAWIRTSPLAYPALEIAHLWALSTLFGSIFVIDLRIIGIRWRGFSLIPIDALARSLLPVAWLAFAFAALSGFLMFISRAADFVTNPAFALKLALIAAAGLNVMVFHLYGNIASPRPLHRWQAALSIVLWAATIAAGRSIAYV